MDAKQLIDKINRAIDGRYEISFYYKPDTDSDSGVNGIRFGQLHTYGQNKNGNDIIRVFQTGGSTSRRKTDKNPSISPDRGYRTFKVANIRNIHVMDGVDGAFKTFEKPISGLTKVKKYRREDGQTTTSTEQEIYNQNGDNTMVRIYNDVDFSQPAGQPAGELSDTRKSSSLSDRSPEPQGDQIQTTTKVPVEPEEPRTVGPQTPNQPADQQDTGNNNNEDDEPEVLDVEDANLVVSPEGEEEEEEVEDINEKRNSYLDFLRESFSLGKK